MKPFVSVLVAIHNVSAYLPACLESILAQHWQAMEVILVDDGSTDDSSNICEQYAAKDTRIRLIRQENGGLFSARNTGIQHATAEYLYFMDGDDWLEPQLLERACRALQQQKADSLLFGHVKELVLADGSVNSMPVLPPSILPSTHEEVVEQMTQLFKVGCGFAVWEQVLKASVIREHKLRFPPFNRGTDMFFLFSFYEVANSIRTLPVALYHYNAFNTGKKFNPNLVENHVQLFEKYLVVFQKNKPVHPYTVQLFTLWFAHVIPTNIVSNKSLTVTEKITWLQTITEHPSVNTKMVEYTLSMVSGVVTKVLLWTLKIRSPRTLYGLTAIKLWVKNTFKFNYKKWF